MLKEHLNLAWCVKFSFVVSKSFTISIGFVHGLDKSVSVNKGEQSDTHPLIASTININMEVGWVEIYDL